MSTGRPKSGKEYESLHNSREGRLESLPEIGTIWSNCKVNITKDKISSERLWKNNGNSLKIELFGIQAHDRGYFFQAGAARFGAVLHLGVGSLSHICPCCNLGLG